MNSTIFLPSSPITVSQSLNVPMSSDLGTEEITQVMQGVLTAKNELIEKAKANTLQRYNPILIGGDLFSMGYLAFEGALSLAPHLQAIPSIGLATLVCGEIAGVINLGVGLVCLKEGIQALKNGDYRGGVRLILDFTCCMAIGLIMILNSLSIRVVALGGVGAFFTANPWLLPLIFFIATLPLIGDLGLRIKDIAQEKNLGAKLQMNALEKLLANKDWDGIEKLCQDPNHPLHVESASKTKEEMVQCLSKKMEELQADMGVTAATETFALMLALQNKDQIAALTHLSLTRKEIGDWNRSIYVRMFQQVLYVGGFGVSMAALSPTANGNLLNGVQNLCLAAANAIPLYMDIFWPFKRNQLIVVPKVGMPSMKVRLG